MDYNELMKNRYDKYLNSGEFNLGGEQPAEEAPVVPPAKELTAKEKGVTGAVNAAAQGGGR